MMTAFLESWQRVPVVIRAILVGLLVSLVGELPWGGAAGYPLLAGWNLLVGVKVPWAIVPMALYLWFYWRYLGGAGWPRATAESRRINLRANRLPPEAWGVALVGGFIGLASTVPLARLMGHLVSLPQEAQQLSVPPGMPSVTILVLLVMSAIVAGVVEEAAFRGYMQGSIERRYGPVTAILVSGTVFGLGHYTHHPAAVLTMLPYYIWISAVYGGLAYTTGSILPGLVLHASGDVFSMVRQWTAGLSEWQAPTTTPTPLVWQTGIDAAFVRPVIVFCILATLMIISYAWLRGMMQTESSQA